MSKDFTSEVYERAEEFRVLYDALKTELEKLPQTRMRSLAITDLESSFARAIFAVGSLEDPIRAR